MSALEQLKEKNQALEQRVEKLEQRLQNPPVSRRGALAGGAGILGLSALSGSASAGSNQVGTIGSSSDRVDIFADDIDANQLIGVSGVGDNHLYAGKFSGSNPDTRLDSCLQAASEGDLIYLENGDYTQNHTISKRGLRLVGTSANSLGTGISGTITLAEIGTSIMHVEIRDSSGSSGEIILDGGRFGRHLVMDTVKGSITITSSTELSIVAFARQVTTTDNGSLNTIVGTT